MTGIIKPLPLEIDLPIKMSTLQISKYVNERPKISTGYPILLVDYNLSEPVLNEKLRKYEHQLTKQHKNLILSNVNSTTKTNDESGAPER